MSRLVWLALAVLAGAGTAVQARINGELAHRLGDGIAAATVSFLVGQILLLCALPWILPGMRNFWTALRKRELLWWQCLGGACGAFLVATQGLTVTTLGVAVFTVAVVAGQSASSVAVDRAGLAPGGPRPVTVYRGVGALLCVIAVVIAVSDRLGDAKALGLAALPALAGIGVAWQQGMNGFVRQASGSALSATLVNFTVGTTLLLVAFAIWSTPRALPPDLWLYLGGPIGIFFIAVAAAVVRHIGVLLLSMGAIAGQIIGALTVDAFAPAAAGPPDLRTYLGATLALAAVALATRVPRQRDIV